MEAQFQFFRAAWRSFARFGRRRIFRDKVFLLVLSATALALGLIALGLPRIWAVSEPSFKPVIRVSWLDLAQARSLKKNARTNMERGEFDRAHYGWGAAIMRNPANPELARGGLSNFIASARGTVPAAWSCGLAFWLLQLTRTNQPDVELAVQVLEAAHEEETLVELLRATVPEHNASLRSAYLSALLRSRRIDELKSCLASMTDAPPAPPELAAYRQALRAAVGDGRELEGALQILEGMKTEPGRAAVSAELQLWLCETWIEPKRYEEYLSGLEQTRAARFRDRIGYWRTLARSGRAAEARSQIAGHSPDYAHAAEALELARLCHQWQWPAEGMKVLERGFKRFPKHPGLSLALAGALLEARQWESLYRLALQMREPGPRGAPWASYSHFLEGRALLAMQRFIGSSNAFAKILETKFQPECRLLDTASALRLLGHTAIARGLLRQASPEMAMPLAFWEQLTQLAHELREERILLQASARLYQMKPADLTAANNYAAALILHQTNAAEAVRLTWSGLAAAPHNATAKINHASALRLNHRNEEAELLLRGMEQTGLTQSEMTHYHFAWLEVCLASGKHPPAEAALSPIDPDHLYPSQIRRLAQVRTALKLASLD